MKPDWWVVGIIGDGEVETFGPFTKATAEAMFKRLNEVPWPAGMRPFISKLSKRRKP